MTANDVIRQVEENASEWLEMSENPTALVVGILAQKVVSLNGYIEYLERRLNNVPKSNLTRSAT